MHANYGKSGGNFCVETFQSICSLDIGGLDTLVTGLSSLLSLGSECRTSYFQITIEIYMVPGQYQFELSRSDFDPWPMARG